MSVLVPPMHKYPDPDLPEALRECSWQKHEARSLRPANTLQSEERNLLHWLTSRYYSGFGAIVDVGCFVGDSTAVLAAGLRGNAAANVIDTTIHAIDDFSS